MKTRTFWKNGLTVSAVGLGCTRFTQSYREDQEKMTGL